MSIFAVHCFCHHFSYYILPTTAFDYPPELGSTLKIETNHETEENLRHHNINDMNAQLDNTIVNPNIVERRDGCIEFILLNRWYSLPKEQQRETCLQFVKTLIQLPNVGETVKPQQEFKIALGGYDKCISLLDENGIYIFLLFCIYHVKCLNKYRKFC